MRSSCTSTYSSHCFNQSYFEVVVEIKEIDFVMCVNIVCAMLSSLLWSIVYLPVLHVYVWPYSCTKSRLHCVHACCSSELAFTAIDQKTEMMSSGDDEETDDAVVEATKRRIINSGHST